MQLLGQHNLCNFGRLKMWAERGLIHIEDTRDNTYEVASVRTALHRLKGISDMLANSREAMKRSGFLYADQYERYQRMVEEMTEICRLAQQQGMPEDASARRDLARRRPATVCLPGAGAEL